MDPTETRQLRALGARLALYVRSEDGPISRATLQAVVADLTAKKPGLGQALGDLVGRPGFSALLTMAGQGRGVVERDALIQEAEQLYLPKVTAALREVLNGFLECSTGGFSTSSDCVPEQPLRERPARPEALIRSYSGGEQELPPTRPTQGDRDAWENQRIPWELRVVGRMKEEQTQRVGCAWLAAIPPLTIVVATGMGLSAVPLIWIVIFIAGMGTLWLLIL